MYLHNLSDYKEIVIILAHTFHYAHEIFNAQMCRKKQHVYCALALYLCHSSPFKLRDLKLETYIKDSLRSNGLTNWNVNYTVHYIVNLNKLYL